MGHLAFPGEGTEQTIKEEQMGWRNVKCLAGHRHKVYVQEQVNSCGPSCVMMAYHRLWGKTFAESLAYEAYSK